jgi:hypothetical protein
LSANDGVLASLIGEGVGLSEYHVIWRGV